MGSTGRPSVSLIACAKIMSRSTSSDRIRVRVRVRVMIKVRVRVRLQIMVRVAVAVKVRVGVRVRDSVVSLSCRLVIKDHKETVMQHYGSGLDSGSGSG